MNFFFQAVKSYLILSLAKTFNRSLRILRTLSQNSHTIDLTKSSLHKDTSAADIGFVANKLLHNLKHKKKISDKDFCSVKADTKTILIAVVKKLLLKAPSSYGLVRNLAWLHPLEICVNQDRCL